MYVFDAVSGNLVWGFNQRGCDGLGASAALSGTTLVVGAPYSAYDAGSYYVFDAATGSLRFEIYNPTGQSSDRFGSSVAVSGTTVVVATDPEGMIPLGQATAAFMGPPSVYVYDGLTLRGTLSDPAPQSENGFGSSIAVGAFSVAVGAPKQSGPASQCGTVHLFDLTDPPVVVDMASNVTTVTDNNVGTAGFSLRITYDRAMDTNVNPAVFFPPNVATTLTYDAAQSWWVSDTAFKAAFDVTDANVKVANINVFVDDAVAADDKVQFPFSALGFFNIDTRSAAPPLAQVTSATPSVAIVTDNNLGTAAFAVRIAYNRTMNTNAAPAITFAPGVASTLTYNSAQSWWASNRTFVARFDVADANVSVPASASTSPGRRTPPAIPRRPTRARTSSASTPSTPAPAPPAVTGAMPSVATVTDQNLETAAFAFRISYNQVMNTNVNPAVTFSPDVASTLTYNRAQSWWVSNTTFVARYDVADANVAVARCRHPRRRGT